MKIGIIGGGISGLSAALALSKSGHEVELFQRESALGGLIATFDFGGVEIEHFYHFLCSGDTGYFDLCEELGLGEHIHFRKALTGFYYEGKSYGFSTALDLLRFTPIPLVQRIRFGLFALEARMRKEWTQLDELTAKPWLIDRLGHTAYKVIWEPLLALKFGDYHDKISAAWVWHRIHRVAKSKGQMGYLEGGTARLLDALVQRLEEQGVVIHRAQPVTQILSEDNHVTGLRCDGADDFHCDRVLSTVPLSVLAKLVSSESSEYAEQLAKISYIGVVCLTLKLKRAVSRNFWLNVNDHRVPFNGIIEFTNLNRLGGDAGHIVYIPYYVATDHAYYTMDDEGIFQQSWQALKAITPGLGDDDLIAHHIARAPYAQAICPTGFLKQLPAHRAPLTGLHVLDSTFLYPEDRTQSGHILKSRACAAHIEE